MKKMQKRLSMKNYILSIDQDGNIIDGFPKRICDIDSNQLVQDVINVEDGVFIVWRDDRGLDTDLYGQLFDYSGNRIGPDEGIIIADYIGDQSGASLAFNSDLNESLVCFENYQSNQDSYSNIFQYYSILFSQI